MNSLVLDCSMTMAWCFDDEATAATRALFDEVQGITLRVPAHWRLEVGNVLALSERKGIPLATLDKELRRSAKKLGVKVVG